MRICLAFLLFFAAIAWPQAAGVLTHESDTQLIIDHGVGMQAYRPPFWSGKQLLTGPIVDSRELVIIVTPANGRNEEVRYQMAGWRRLIAVGLWGGYDGSIVLAGSGTEDSGDYSAFVGWIAPDHKTRRIAKIDGDLRFTAFTVEPSGVILAIASNKWEPREDHSDTILTRIDPTGRVLSATKLDIRSSGGGKMIASATRVSWLTDDNHYYEFSMDGSQVYDAPGPPRGQYVSNFEAHMAVSLSGTVLVSRPVREKKQTRTAVFALDRLQQSWYEPETAKGSPAIAQIYGFDGDTLVTAAHVKDLGDVLRRYKLSER